MQHSQQGHDVIDVAKWKERQHIRMADDIFLMSFCCHLSRLFTFIRKIAHFFKFKEFTQMDWH